MPCARDLGLTNIDNVLTVHLEFFLHHEILRKNIYLCRVSFSVPSSFCGYIFWHVCLVLHTLLKKKVITINIILEFNNRIYCRKQQQTT